MDPKVREVQVWLNETYGNVKGWVPVEESGITGWNVIYGLRRGLQAELGISPVASGFGDATKTAYRTKIGILNSSSVSSQNLLRLVSGALFCKGYVGSHKIKGETLYYTDDLAQGVFACRVELGLVPSTDSVSDSNSGVDVKLMASLLSMDAYRIPWSSKGNGSIREVQQWLNSKYSPRGPFSLVPTDGIFSRQIQTAILFALQFEMGMSDTVANGNFGPGTKSGLKTQAAVALGSADSSKSFVRLFQAALRFNGIDTPFSGSFDSATQQRAIEFQEFMALNTSGSGDYDTWCSLLVSSGDPDAAVTGLDLSRQLTPAAAVAARSAGFTHVGRYLTGITKDANNQPVQKFLSIDEIEALASANLRFFPIMQVLNYAPDMTYDEGVSQAIKAASRLRAHGVPDGTTAYFAVDFDATQEVIKGPVFDFFEGINSVLKRPAKTTRVGVYGSRNVCNLLLAKGLAEDAFVAGASTGFSGNMGMRMPSDWSFNQIAVDRRISLAGTSYVIDRVRVSPSAKSVDAKTVAGAPRQPNAPINSSGIAELMEYISEAEVRFARLAEPSDSPAFRAAMATGFAYHLCRPYLASAGITGVAWNAYLAPVIVDESLINCYYLALSAARDISTPLPAGDVAHLAATTSGYRRWDSGLTIPFEGHGWGDLGGWGLDLLSFFGSYLRQSSETLEEYSATHLGRPGMASAFGYEDLQADADGYLYAGMGGLTSDSVRVILKQPPATRLNQFYSKRFDAKAENIARAASSLFDGIDFASVNLGFTKEYLRRVASLREDDPDPTPAEIGIMAKALGRVLSQ